MVIELLNFWDLAYEAGDHEEHWEPGHVPQELAMLVAAGLLLENSVTLDVGCGGGYEAIFLAQRGMRASGVDKSPAALEIARHRAREAGVEVDWREGDVFDLPLESASIDLAHDRGCLHTIARRRRRAYAREVARVLKPGGRFLLRGAREDDEDAGLVGIGVAEIDRLFPPGDFTRGPVVPIALPAPAETLDGCLVLLQKRG